jgi:hypothetical protein
LAEPGDMVLIPMSATAGDAAVAGIVVFLDPALFSVFGLPPTR